jgi:hypothetical protein
MVTCWRRINFAIGKCFCSDVHLAACGALRFHCTSDGSPIANLSGHFSKLKIETINIIAITPMFLRDGKPHNYLTLAISMNLLLTAAEQALDLPLKLHHILIKGLFLVPLMVH